MVVRNSNEINYITPAGAEALQIELRTLKHVERPKLVDTIAWAASNGDRSENADYIYGKRRLREIDRRIEHLLKRLEMAEVIDPGTVRSDKVLFGATVTILDEDANTRTYKIIGVDEIDLEKGHISWRSPLGTALLNKRVGDIAIAHTPKGERELEITQIEYKS